MVRGAGVREREEGGEGRDTDRQRGSERGEMRERVSKRTIEKTF